MYILKEYSRNPLKAYLRKGITPYKAWLHPSTNSVGGELYSIRHRSAIRDKAYPSAGKRHRYAYYIRHSPT